MRWRQSTQDRERGACRCATLDQRGTVSVRGDAAPSLADQPLQYPLQPVAALDDAMLGVDAGDDARIIVALFSKATDRDHGHSRETGCCRRLT